MHLGWLDKRPALLSGAVQKPNFYFPKDYYDCGRRAQISATHTSKTTETTVIDKCPNSVYPTQQNILQ